MHKRTLGYCPESLSHVLEHMVRDGLSSGNITFGFDKSASWIVCSRQDT